MNRRNFLKLSATTGALLALPVLAKSEPLKHKFTIHRSLVDNEAWYLKTPAFSDERMMRLESGLQEGLDIIAEIEWVEV